MQFARHVRAGGVSRGGEHLPRYVLSLPAADAAVALMSGQDAGGDRPPLPAGRLGPRRAPVQPRRGPGARGLLLAPAGPGARPRGWGMRPWPGTDPLRTNAGSGPSSPPPASWSTSRGWAIDIYRTESGALSASALGRTVTFAELAMDLFVDGSERAVPQRRPGPDSQEYRDPATTSGITTPRPNAPKSSTTCSRTGSRSTRRRAWPRSTSAWDWPRP